MGVKLSQAAGRFQTIDLRLQIDACIPEAGVKSSERFRFPDPRGSMDDGIHCHDIICYNKTKSDQARMSVASPRLAAHVP